MLELKREELEQLVSVLGWVMVSTRSTQEERQQLTDIYGKLKNILKSVSSAKEFSIEVVDDEKIGSL